MHVVVTLCGPAQQSPHSGSALDKHHGSVIVVHIVGNRIFEGSIYEEPHPLYTDTGHGNDIVINHAVRLQREGVRTLPCTYHATKNRVAKDNAAQNTRVTVHSSSRRRNAAHLGIR